MLILPGSAAWEGDGEAATAPADVFTPDVLAAWREMYTIGGMPAFQRLLAASRITERRWEPVGRPFISYRWGW
jgi:hypothetical protein